MSALAGTCRVGRAKATHAYADSFIAAAGLTNATQLAALHQREADLLAAGLLDPYDPTASVLLAVYPFVGGTASAHRFNLVDPTTFAQTFYGSPGHSATGMQTNGSTQLAAGGIYPAQHQAQDSHALGVYYRSSGGNYSVGARLGGNFYSLRTYNGATFFGINAGEGGLSTQGLGFRAISRLPGDRTFFASNSTVTAFTNTQGGPNLNLQLFLGALNNEGGGGIFDAIEVADFFVARTGLDADQLLAYEAACHAFQVTLNRAV